MLTFDPSFFIGVFPRLISALPFTVEVIIASILLCLFFGTIIAVIRIARVPVLAPFCDIWLSYNRSMPFILDLYLVYFCLPAIIRGLGINPDGWPLTVYVLVSLTFHYAPVVSEILRPAYLSVDRGQHEAAIVFGLSPVRRVFSIIAPQALPVAIPGLVSESINILKDTSNVLHRRHRPHGPRQPHHQRRLRPAPSGNIHRRRPDLLGHRHCHRSGILALPETGP